jgi:phosphatidylserine/phosphatidylglycerophosphate/cardiolipin synthase-like enzyme
MNKRTTSVGGGIIILIIAILSIALGRDLFTELGVSTNTVPSDSDPVNLPPVNDNNPDWYEIYFTNPVCPPEEERVGGLDETIAEDIRQAQLQVDVAGFDIDAEPIVQALIDLEAQGVTVRVVTDEDNAELSSIRRLRRNGISVVEDKRSALMHNKFIVVDGRYIWMGSLNYTTNGVYCNNNNLVRFDSARMAANYLAEMDEMYDDNEFGPTSSENTPNEQMRINGIQVENYFGPETKIAPIIARAVAGAQSEILFMAFSFTDDQIGEAMLGRVDAGVTLRGVFETTGSDTVYSYYPHMAAAGLDNIAVRTDGNPRIMHHKVIIIDRETTIFGSYNFSDSANTKNDENIIIVHDPTFTSFFVEEFETVWAEANSEE